MMKRSRVFAVSAAALAGCLLAGGAMAGQFKTITGTPSLPVNGVISVVSSPRSAGGGGMDYEAYEWASAATTAIYQCRILQNATGKLLNLRMVGVNGTIIGSCSAANGATCNTPSASLVANRKFLCLVTTDSNQVGVGGQYRVGIARVGTLSAEPAAAPTPEMQAAGVAQ